MPGVEDLLQRLGGGYTEISPSGKGLHVFGYSACSTHGGINTMQNGLRVELYSAKRFLTVTGNQGTKFFDSDCGDQLPGYQSLLFELTAKRSGLVKEPIFPQLTQETQVFQDLQEFEDMNDIQASGAPLFCKIEELPGKCLVHAPGQRNKACFELARWVKGNAPNSSRPDLQTFVLRWHEFNLPNMDTKDFDETWVDFLYGLHRVNVPYGQSLEEVLADLPDLPSELRDHGLGDKGTVLLQLCLGLAQRSVDGVFFLSGHVASKYLDCTPQWAYKLFSLFVDNGFLELISKGFRSKASEYRMPCVEQVKKPVCSFT